MANLRPRWPPPSIGASVLHHCMVSTLQTLHLAAFGEWTVTFVAPLARCGSAHAAPGGDDSFSGHKDCRGVWDLLNSWRHGVSRHNLRSIVVPVVSLCLLEFCDQLRPRIQRIQEGASHVTDRSAEGSSCLESAMCRMFGRIRGTVPNAACSMQKHEPNT